MQPAFGPGVGVARRTARPLDRLRVLWARPGWRPADLGGPLQPPEVDRSSYVKFEVPLGTITAATVVVTVPLVILVLIFQKRIVAGLTAGAVKG